MPTYNFRNIETGDVTEELMSISAKEDYLKANPHLVSIMIKAPMTVGGVGEINSKVDNGFKELLGGIADANPYSPMADTWGTKKDVKSVASKKAAVRANAKHGSAPTTATGWNDTYYRTPGKNK